MPITPKKLVKILQKNGFKELRQRGSHKVMYNENTNRTTVVPMHNKDIDDSFYKDILKQAGLKWS
ncbi:type II toxin-antitoxin system HicA family toxin [Aerococcus christensenii]|uniref:type II toxin-antitoxin system HicA family toxin n=2 Tax=Aerococcus christensenii TaxID=87541 RepID=UPI00076313C6|nr:type II toxin-antitoxin system HicA family toxin [Aerococcus christensenii]AMB92912.1 toxin HicA [Aerococcus christensenii]